MFCSKCGAEITGKEKFCTKCGNPVMGESFNKVNNTSETMEKQEGEISQKTPEKEKKNRITIIALLGVIALLMGVILFCGYYFLFQKNAQGETASEKTDYSEEKNMDDGDTEEPKTEEATVGMTEQEAYVGEREDINISVRQVDNSNFPEITFYANITDTNGQVVENLEKADFKVQEIDTAGNVLDVGIEDVYKVTSGKGDRISINLVLDASGSMDAENKMAQAKNAAITLINRMNLSGGDQAEIISFDDYVYLEQDFTRDGEALRSAINNIITGGSTALYDAIYAGLFQSYYEDGVKCVIAFTDGAENASSYTFENVVNMAQNTSIPVFIIGIGEEYDADVLQNLAAQCAGKYYSANVNNLESVLSDIYLGIYQEQQDYYAFRYTTTNREKLSSFRSITVATSETAQFYGSHTKEYIPQSDITGAFSAAYMDKDYILDFSSQREVTASDISGLSLAELRIARNEIFARHGRQFKDSMLNQWFYSKVWYLNLAEKYAPDYFDNNNPSPLSDLERENAEFILEYEQNKMNTQDIYPNADTTVLSDYDLSLSKAVLKNALVQVSRYPSTEILGQNILRIQEAIDRKDVEY